MTVLYGFMETQETWGKDSVQYNRIVVMNTQGFSGQVPIASIDKVRGTENDVDAVPYSWYGGLYQDKQMPFAQFATDPAHAFSVWPEFSIAAEQLTAWQENRQGCVVDRRLAEKCIAEASPFCAC